MGTPPLASLFLAGNTNCLTFLNSIAVADSHARRNQSGGLDRVLVIHTEESFAALSGGAWKRRLLELGIDPQFIDLQVNLNLERPGMIKQLERLAETIAIFVKGRDPRTVYLDLTNGTALYKNVLAKIGFALGIEHQFTLPAHVKGELDPEALPEAYVSLPHTSSFDELAKSWLTDIRRYRYLLDSAGLLRLKQSAERNFIREDVLAAVDQWFTGSRVKDGSTLSGAVGHVGRAFEMIVRTYGRDEGSAGEDRSLRRILSRLQSTVARTVPREEAEFFRQTTSLLAELRNTAAHRTLPPHAAELRARLAVELILIVLDTLGSLEDSIATDAATKESHSLIADTLHPNENQDYYVGIDGDDIGLELQEYFADDAEASDFARFSNKISTATREVAKRAKELGCKILFQAGDDIFFRGKYRSGMLEELQELFEERAGQSCSIGFGPTPRDAYVAMKLAKARPGKRAIVGLETRDTSRVESVPAADRLASPRSSDEQSSE